MGAQHWLEELLLLPHTSGREIIGLRSVYTANIIIG
jgi:hypothetical protein